MTHEPNDTTRDSSAGEPPAATPPSFERVAEPARLTELGTDLGSRVFGKFRLVAHLGHGGMAEVFLAAARGPDETGFSKLQVLKLLRPDLADEREFVDMLLDEARLAAQLNHPNVVQTLEAGCVDRRYFIAMEYLDGQPWYRVLRRARKRHGKLRPALAYHVISEVLAGLHHAHELRDFYGDPLDVVHRDISPPNVFVTYDGQVKVMDFGIAKARGRITSTSTGVLKGKVSYMAPEQALDMAVDRRTDLFAVGIMLWEAATGRRFWGDARDLHILHRLLSKDYEPSPQAVAPDVPDAIDAICRRALAFSPADRYADAAELQADIEAYLEGVLGAERASRRAAGRELGRSVAALFEDDRRELDELIAAQMAALHDGEATLPVPRARRGEPTPSEQRLGFAETAVIPTVTTVRSRRAASPRWPIVAAGAVAVAAVLAASQLTPRAVSLARSSLVPPAPAVVEPSPDPPPPETVKLRVRTRPPGATVELDGEALGDGDGELPRSAREHELRVRAPGHATFETTITLDQDVDMTVELRPLSPPAARRRPPVARAKEPRDDMHLARGPIRPIDEEAPW